MKKQSTWIFLVIACIFTAIGVFTNHKKSELNAAKTSAVTELFAVSVPDPRGKIQSLSQWKGKVLLVNYWATWCAPCVEEMPELSNLQLDASKKNIQIIGIGIDSAANIAEFSSKYKISFPLYVADTKSMELLRKFGNQSGGLPFTILIGPNGQIKKSYLGRLKLEELKRDLELP